MTYSDDFVPIEDNRDLEDPNYPSVFGIELKPSVQGILVALLGVGAAAFLFVQFVSNVQQTRQEAAERVEDKEEIFRNQEESLQRVEAVRAELDEALTQREGIYSLLGNPDSLDTLLLDINQQIERSNASIEETITQDLSRLREILIDGTPFTEEQIDRFIQEDATDSLVQKLFYTSELSRFNPLGLSGPVNNEYGEALNGQLERQVVEVEFQALFNQTQNIIRNLERLEPLLIIRDFEQSLADPPDGIDEETMNLLGISRLLNTSFTMEVLVPVGDPREPPQVTEAETSAEGEEDTEDGEDTEEDDDEEETADEDE